MRFLALATTALLASNVSARFFESSSSLRTAEDDLAVPGENPLQHCADPKDDILKITSVDLDPNPPKRGTELNIVAKGDVKEEIAEGAYVKIRVKYGLIQLINMTKDLCELVGEVGLECPIKKGELKLTKAVELPNEIPPGKFTVWADVYSADDEQITCLTGTVAFPINKDSGMLKVDM